MVGSPSFGTLWRQDAFAQSVIAHETEAVFGKPLRTCENADGKGMVKR